MLFQSLFINNCYIQGPYSNHKQHAGRLLRRCRGGAIVEKGIDGTGRSRLSSTIIAKLQKWRFDETRNLKKKKKSKLVIFLSVGDRFAHDYRKRMYFRQQGT